MELPTDIISAINGVVWGPMMPFLPRSRPHRSGHHSAQRLTGTEPHPERPVRDRRRSHQPTGRTGIDGHATVDLTSNPLADVGSRVEFWGPNLPVETIARECGTIPYDMVSQITTRVPRRY